MKTNNERMEITYEELMESLAEVNKRLRCYTREQFNDIYLENCVEIVIDIMPYSRKPIEAKVNWCALGHVDAKQALAMSRVLERAWHEATYFQYNNYVIKHN